MLQQIEPQAGTAEEVSFAETPPQKAGFADLGISSQLLAAVTTAGYTQPTDIQREAIPLAIAGKDIVGLAQTGSGKTAAYVLATLTRLKRSKSAEILVLTPTRELAAQVAQVFTDLGEPMGIRVAPVVGGQSMYRQIELYNRGCEVIVATPGRLLDLMSCGKLSKKFAPHMVVLDEVDEMLDMGFIDDIRTIIKSLPEDRQSLMFSATVSGPIRKLIGEFADEPQFINVRTEAGSAPKIEQRLYVVPERERMAALVRLLQFDNPEKGMIFCRMRIDVDTVQEALSNAGIRAQAIHGDMSQPVRTAAIKSLKEGRTQLLVATDVASRGIDVDGLTHVYNYHLPDNYDRYVHRIGRTGRAGNSGIAVTIAAPEEVRRHRLFAKHPPSAFVASRVPTRSMLQSVLDEQLMQQITAIKPSDSALQLCDELFKSDAAYVLMSQMLTKLQDGRRALGQETIGFDPAQKFDRPRDDRRDDRRPGKKPYGRRSNKPFNRKGRK